jgi:hypothetical protein
MRRHDEASESVVDPRPMRVANGWAPGLLALQRAAGNAAVASLFGQPAEPRVEPPLELPVEVPNRGEPVEILREAEHQPGLGGARALSFRAGLDVTGIDQLGRRSQVPRRWAKSPARPGGGVL